MDSKPQVVLSKDGDRLNDDPPIPVSLDQIRSGRTKKKPHGYDLAMEGFTDEGGDVIGLTFMVDDDDPENQEKWQEVMLYIPPTDVIDPRIAELEAENAKLQQALEAAGKRLTATEKERDEAQAEAKAHKEALEPLRKSVEKLKSEKGDLEAEITKIKAELEALKKQVDNGDPADKGRIAELEGKLKACEEAKGKMAESHKSEVKNLTDEIERLKSNLGKSEEALSKSKAEATTLTAHLEQARQSHKAQLDIEKRKTEEAENAKVTAEGRATELEGKLKTANGKYSELEEKFNEALDNAKKLQDKRRELEDQVKQLEEDLTEARKGGGGGSCDCHIRIAQLESEIRDLERNVKVLERKVNGLEAENTTVQRITQRRDADVADLRDQLRQLGNN